MIPQEAIAILGGTVEAARARVALAAKGPCCTVQEHEAIHALALHALTDSGARGALSRVRAWLIDKNRMIDRGPFGWSHENHANCADTIEAIDRELAALPPTSGLTQSAPIAESSSTGQDTSVSSSTASVAGEAGSTPADSPTSPGLTIADTEDWMGKLCEDSAAIDKEAEGWRKTITGFVPLELRASIMANVGTWGAMRGPTTQRSDDYFESVARDIDQLCALAAPNAKLREAALQLGFLTGHEAYYGDRAVLTVRLSPETVQQWNEAVDALSAAPEAAKDDEVAELRAKLEAAEGRIQFAIKDRQVAEDIQAELARDLAAARADQRAVAVEELTLLQSDLGGYAADCERSVAIPIDTHPRCRAWAYRFAMDKIGERIAALTARVAEPATIDIGSYTAGVMRGAALPNPSETPNSSPAQGGDGLSMVQCNYDSDDFPRQVVEALDELDTRLRALEGK